MADLPEAVAQACAEAGVKLADCLAYRLYPDRVMVVLKDGRKLRYPLVTGAPAPGAPAVTKPAAGGLAGGKPAGGKARAGKK